MSLNSLEGPEAIHREVEHLRAHNARLREEIARLREGPARAEDRRAIRALRLVIAALWLLGAVSAVVLGLALLAFLGVAAGGLKG